MATSKGKRGASTDASTSSSEQDGASQTTRTRNNRAGAKTDGDATSTSRRNKNEPGRYQKRNDDVESMGRSGRSGKSRAEGSMSSAFDDEDIADESVNNYDADADDIDWDDTPARGGGRNPDE